IRMPGERKEPLGLHFLHDGLPFEVLVARIGNLPTRHLTRYKGAIQFHPKPLAKPPVIRQRTPDARNWRLEFNALLNTVVHSTQPIPPGFHTVTPSLIVRNGAEAIEFYKKALGAQELMRMAGPDGKIGHAELKIGDSIVFLTDENPAMGCKSPQTLGGTASSL